jgi:hypothetical protein
MADDKGYYVFWGCPTELKTDQQYTYQMSTTGGDMTDVTYKFRWEFTCDGVTTKETIASGLTSLTYTWTPTSVKFGPLMKKSKSGTLKLIVATSTGKMTYSKVLPLTISDSIKPLISGATITRTNDFNDLSVSNITSHKLSFNVAGLYGADQTVTVGVGDNNYTKSVGAVAGNAATKVEFDLGVFDAGTSDTYKKAITIHVADSRSNIADTSTSIDIYKYVRPTVEASVYRNANNEKAYIAFTPTIQTTVAGAANSISLFYARSILGTTVVQTDLKTSPQQLNGADDIDKSYNVFVFLKDAVGGIAVARLVLPSNIPVMDIGSDGKTVTFFGTSPTTSDEELLTIGKLASFGKQARIGFTDIAYTLIGTNGFSYCTSQTEKPIMRIGSESTDYINPYIAIGPDNSGYYGLAIGNNNYIDGGCAIGIYNRVKDFGLAIGAYCVIGQSVTMSGYGTLAAGIGVEAYRNGQCVFGKYNVIDNGSDELEKWERQIFIVGNGTSDTDRSSAFIIYEDGSVYISGNAQANKFRLYTFLDSDAIIDCLWLDKNYHPIVSRGQNSNTAYFGPYANSYQGEYTVTNVRGRTVQIKGTAISLSGNTWVKSDERLKEDFQSLDKWESFFDYLEPCAFKFKDGTSGRYHLGFKAQQVKESLEKSGLTTKDFAGFVTDKYLPDEENVDEIKLYHKLGIDPGEDIHGLNYTEFVALQHNEIQKLKERVKNLETEINALKQ